MRSVAKIRITVTEVLEYEPKTEVLVDYLNNEVKTIEHAFAFDKKLYENDEYSLNEIVGSNDGKLVHTKVEWSIVDG
jgi:hypothetical protein